MKKAFLIVFIILFYACQPNYRDKINVKHVDVISDNFINAHKILINNEEKKIDSLLSASWLPFIKDSTGIRIYIDEDVSNKKLQYPQNGNHVLLAYHCIVFEESDVIVNDLLEDTIFFKLGHSKQMKGLNHAIKLLKTGDNAKIIIPSYLGFGMSGYKNSVLPYSTLLLNVKLLNIKE